MVEMNVDSVRINEHTYHRVVVLRQKDGDRCLPIWVGNSEADAIVMKLQDVKVPRPQTHDLLVAIINQLGARVERIVVSELADDVFYARIVVEAGGRYLEIDSRPSDAIALAVRAKAPIFVEDSVLDRAGVTLDGESTDDIAQAALGAGEPLCEEELRKLSAFRDFINSLDLDDLEKKNSD